LTDTPGGNVIDIQTNLAGKFKIANQARVFAGNNRDPETEVGINLINEEPKTFDGGNSVGLSGTVTSYNSSNVTIQSAEALDWYQGTMLFYNTDGAAASGLTNNTTYFVDFLITQPNNVYTFTLKPLPTSSAISTISGGSGTQTFKQIGVSIDKDIFHLKDNGYQLNDMLRYEYPVGGRIDADEDFNFYFIKTRYDQHNFNLSHTLGSIIPTTIERIGNDWGTPITPTTVTIVGFQTPLSFAVTSGVLPTGLTLNTSTGVVSGTPTETIDIPGREVVITLTDAEGSQGIQTHTYQFNQPPQLYSFSSATFTTGGVSGRDGPSISQARNGVGNPSWASQYLNMNQNGVQLWTVPQNGTYRIGAYGAVGGYSTRYGQRGGYGAYSRGDIILLQGQVLKIVVGQSGGNQRYDAGGGGASYVSTSDNSPLIVGGAGGGGSASDQSYKEARTSQSTNNQYGSPQTGYGGTNYNSTPGGGGGFYGDGAGSWRGIGFTNGSRGGEGTSGGYGGFGGGGGGGQTNGAGGGGGYTGGNASPWSNAASGGGSYVSGSNQYQQAQYSGGDGQVSIQRV
jgi:hypothetical protein